MAQKKNKRPVAYTGSNTTAKKTNGGTVLAVIAFILVCIVTLGLFAGFSKANKGEEIDALRAEIAALKDDVAKGDAKLKDGYTDGDAALSGLIAAGDATLTGKIESGDSVLSNQIIAGDKVLSDSISDLEESIVWYQHDVRLTIKVESTETGGSATAIGYCAISLINNNPNAYDCIDVGNGNNALVSDLATTGSKNTSGYCLVDYSTYEGGYGRRLMYLLQNTTIFNDTTEGSVYDGNHLYVYVYSVYSEGDFATPNVQSQLIPKIIITYEPDGTPVYNGGRLVLTDTDGIKTATIADTVTTISLK